MRAHLDPGESCEVKKMHDYIQSTGIKAPGDNFAIHTSELNAIYALFMTDPFQAIVLAFDFGRARGYRCAQERKEAA